MKNFLSTILTSLTLLLLAGCGGDTPSPVSGQTASASSLENRFRAVISQNFRSNRLTGVAAGLWVPGQPPTILTLGQSDVPNGMKIRKEDHFRIGSVTKSFTVTALLQLADEGKLSLEDPIEKYLPSLQNGSATLAQLADMTSGIYNYTNDQEILVKLLSDLTAEFTEQELLDAANRNTPYFSPGGGWHYSNTNTVALGLVIEQVTGNTLARELENRIFQPLGLTNTSYPSGLELPLPFAHGYGLFEEGGELQDVTASSPSASAGSGAMVSTLEDLRVWGKALGSGSLVSSQLQERRLQLVSTDGCPECPEYDAYGLGIGTLNGWRGHTGDYLGYQALVMYEPKTEAVIVILTNFKNFTSAGHFPTDMFREIVE